MDRKEYAQDDGVIYEDNSDDEESSLKELKEYISNCVTSRINPEIMDQINGDRGEYHMATDVSESVIRYILKNKESILKGLQNYEN